MKCKNVILRDSASISPKEPFVVGGCGAVWELFSLVVALKVRFLNLFIVISFYALILSWTRTSLYEHFMFLALDILFTYCWLFYIKRFYIDRSCGFNVLQQENAVDISRLPLTDFRNCLWFSSIPGKRYSLPNSRIMIHQPLGGAQGQQTDIEIQVHISFIYLAFIFKLIAPSSHTNSFRILTFKCCRLLL